MSLDIQWFKNIQLFQIQEQLDIKVDDLQDLLLKKSFRPCGSYEWKSLGWVSPITNTELLHFRLDKCILLRLRVQEKILPATVIRDFVRDKIANIEAEQLRTVHRKERNEIKDLVTQELLPRALPKNNEIWLYLDLGNQWLIIDNSSRSKAEDVASFLRATLGSLPLIAAQFDPSISSILTTWLKTRHLPTNFNLGEDCKLVASEGESVTCKQMDLTAHEVQEHLNSGKIVEYLGLNFADRIDFILDQDFAIKRLKFTDLNQEDSDEQDFSLMHLEYSNLIKQLFIALAN
jgi:recombination associated protein RdgC